MGVSDASDLTQQAHIGWAMAENGEYYGTLAMDGEVIYSPVTYETAEQAVYHAKQVFEALLKRDGVPYAVFRMNEDKDPVD